MIFFWVVSQTFRQFLSANTATFRQQSAFCARHWPTTAVVVLNLMIGLIHPPMGLNLLIAQSIAKEPMEAILKESIPLLGIMLLILLLVTFIPATVLWLPNAVGM